MLILLDFVVNVEIERIIKNKGGIDKIWWLIFEQKKIVSTMEMDNLKDNS